jgi:hypothetical protein
MGHIFISYSHQDAIYVKQLATALDAEGFNVWVDQRIDYGMQWPFEIEKQLDSSDLVIVVMTPQSKVSQWVQSELARALRKGIPVIPLLLKGAEPWLAVESLQYLDVRDGQLPSSGFYDRIDDLIHPNADSQISTELAPSKGYIPSLRFDGMYISLPYKSSGDVDEFAFSRFYIRFFEDGFVWQHANTADLFSFMDIEVFFSFMADRDPDQAIASLLGQYTVQSQQIEIWTYASSGMYHFNGWITHNMLSLSYSFILYETNEKTDFPNLKFNFTQVKEKSQS